MKILAFDCSSTRLNIVLSIENKRYIRIYEEGLNHSVRLMPTIVNMLEEAGIKPGELDLIGSTAGPGSFTGLRITMATGKGLSTSIGRPFISIPTLDFLSMGASNSGVIVPVIDGKKERLYCAVYENGELIDGPWDISIEELLEKIQKHDDVTITGPDANLLDNYTNSKIKIDPSYTNDKPENLIELTEKFYKKNGPDHPGSGPFYIRKSQAEE
ncbi:MAG: tRNA (adenosine(37)-N6)-threonylcarbamoyltransferase complex dimerization subunit type 1 TsaB [Spirochaetales bacterium]|nr:tRNA (adenosine(37)-N6)-threonylcarbamoyltransferase complex dimerization subunit type 1 TsaB [Spirochaetales bacterium]